MSDWVHSRYVRHLADTALGGRPVRIDLSVRRLYCENPACMKVTFAEQVDGLTVRYQRRTPLLQHLVEILGIVLAGRGGARLLSILNTALSRTSVLFHLMRVPLPPAITPRVLGETISPYTRAPTGPCWSTLAPGSRSPCGRAATPRRSAPGSARIQAWRSSAGTARPPTGRASPPAHRTRCRSATAFICGRGCPGGCRRSPPHTGAACLPRRPIPNLSSLSLRRSRTRRWPIRPPDDTRSDCSKRCTR